MPQKVIEIVGASKESFAKAAENAVAEAAEDRAWHEVGAGS
jgi:flavin-binding protein dodecin